MAHPPANRAVVVVEPGRTEIQNAVYPVLPSDDYIVVRTTAVAVCPSDWKSVDLAVEGRTVVGCHVGYDFAGVVEEVGPAVKKALFKGDRVAGTVHGTNVLNLTEGSFANYISAKGDIVMKIPDNTTDAEASTIAVTLLAAGLSLYKSLGLPRPSAPAEKPFTIFVYGGTTASAIVGIQFAKLSGATVITTASPANTEYIKSLGADHVLDYKSPTLADDILALASGPLQLAWDCHGDEASSVVCAQILSREGDAKIATLSPFRGDTIKTANPHVAIHLIIGFTVFGTPYKLREIMDPVPEDSALFASLMDEAAELMAQGKLKAPRIILNEGGSGLEGASKGLGVMRSGQVSAGKLVYTI